MAPNPLDHLLSDGGFCGIFRSIGCIGDSLASGELESQMNGVIRYHDYYEYSWGQYIARACGCTVIHFSRGGLSAKEFVEKMDQDDLLNLADPKRRCQAYIVALGYNDISAIARGEQTFGSMADIHFEAPTANADSFAGNYGRLLSAIKRVEPKARVFLVTMPVSTNDVREPLRDKHAELSNQIADILPFTYVIDLRKHAPVYDDAFKKKYYIGNHMNAMGYLLTAKMIMTYIDAIVQSKPEEFAQIGFVGRGNNLHNETALW